MTRAEWRSGGLRVIPVVAMSELAEDALFGVFAVIFLVVIGAMMFGLGAVAGYCLTTGYNGLVGSSVDPHLGAVVGGIIFILGLDFSDD